MTGAVTAADERLHPPGDALSWTESASLELHDEASELAGSARLDVRPNEGTTEVALSFFLPDGGFITARHVAPRVVDPARDVEVEDVRFATTEPLRRWRVAYDGPAHSLASAADTGKQDAWVKSRLERLIVDLDVVAAAPAERATDAFAQPVTIGGEVWVSGDHYVLAAHGMRIRTWGDGVVPAASGRVALAFPDGRAVFARRWSRDGAEACDGWLLRDGVASPVAAVELALADGGADAGGHVALALAAASGRTALDVELLQVAPLPGLRGAHPYVVRLAVARARWDGSVGHGFAELLE